MSKSICEIPRWQLLKSKLNNLDSIAFLKQYHATSNAILLDVRTLEEYNRLHLNNAIHFDYLGPDFLDQLDGMDKNIPYFIYCQSSRRSTRTCTLLKNSGFENIYNLEGGLNEVEDVYALDIVQ